MRQRGGQQAQERTQQHKTQNKNKQSNNAAVSTPDVHSTKQRAQKGPLSNTHNCHVTYTHITLKRERERGREGERARER